MDYIIKVAHADKPGDFQKFAELNGVHPDSCEVVDEIMDSIEKQNIRDCIFTIEEKLDNNGFAKCSKCRYRSFKDGPTSDGKWCRLCDGSTHFSG